MVPLDLHQQGSKNKPYWNAQHIADSILQHKLHMTHQRNGEVSGFHFPKFFRIEIPGKLFLLGKKSSSSCFIRFRKHPFNRWKSFCNVLATTTLHQLQLGQPNTVDSTTNILQREILVDVMLYLFDNQRLAGTWTSTRQFVRTNTRCTVNKGLQTHDIQDWQTIHKSIEQESKCQQRIYEGSPVPI